MRFGAMILAAGRGERMRPLSDATPKPLLEAGGKPLVVWQIEALARAGFTRIVINAAHLAAQLVERLGDGSALGVTLAWSVEPEALETAGGIATALPLLPPGPALVVSGDVHTDFDYATLLPRAAAMARAAAAAPGPGGSRDVPAPPRAHLVMVDNPPYHPRGDFALVADGAGGLAVARDGEAKLTFGNIGVYDTALFAALPRHVKRPLAPLFGAWIDAGIVSGEHYRGRWTNVGTPADLARLDRELAAAPPATPPLSSAEVPR